MTSFNKSEARMKQQPSRRKKLVGQSGFEPPTNGYLQLQNFVILPKESAYPFCDASGAHRNTGLYYYPAPIKFLIIEQTNIYSYSKDRTEKSLAYAVKCFKSRPAHSNNNILKKG